MDEGYDTSEETIQLVALRMQTLAELDGLGFVDIAENLAQEGLLRKDKKFVCPAVMHHGPGSQSSTRCERKTPHNVDEEHYASNPMEPGFEWVGKDGWGNR